MTERPIQTESELVELVRGSDVRAPQRLHDRVQALVDARTGAATPTGAAPARRRLRPLPALLGTAAAAAAALVIAFAVVGGGGSGLTVQSASAFTLAGATAPAPAESSTDGTRLATAVDGVAFPYWEESLGWRTVGTRHDRLDGREIRTVYYIDASGRRIGYAIVGGTPPPPVSEGVVWRHRGTDYRILRLHGAEAVVWLRDGRLCIVSGRGVGSATLLRLASWTGASRAA